MTTNYFPPLTDLLDASAIPGDIEFLEGGAQAVIDLLLGKIFYKDLAIDVSSAGEESVYSLTLVTKSIRQPLFGTGMELVFFRCTLPDGSECPDAQYSEFPIIFNWRWGIKKYISGFEAKGFAYTPEAFMDIFFALAGIQDFEEFFEAILDVFLDNGTNAYLAFFDELRSTIQSYDNGSNDVATEIQNIADKIVIIRDEVSALLNNSNLFDLKRIYQNYQDNPTIQSAVESIKTSIENLRTTFDIDVDVYTDVVKAVIKDTADIDEKFEKLIQLFKTWLADITLEEVKNLLIPQFAVELTGINMALEFPRNILLPMKESGGVWQVNPDGKAAIVFTAGNIAYSTETGFDIGIDEGLEIDLPRCMVPNLGLQLEFLDVKLDLSRKYNIAEAIADDRPENFIGAYVREANIILPEKWFKFDEDGSTLKLFADNIIVGTGGLSGTIGLAAVSGLDPVLQDNMLLSDGVTTISIIPGADNIPDEGDDVVFGTVAAEDGRYVLQGGGALIVENHKLKRFLSSDGELTYKLGKASGNGQWKIGFSQFYLKFWQNKIQESEIKGSLTVPNFKQCGKTGDLKIDISVFFENDGDFRITAAPEGGLTICLGEEGKVFKIKIESLEAGKDDEKLYLQVTGALDFSKNPLLSKFLKSPIEVKKLRIYSDGSFEIEGGSIPIPGTVHLNLGPVEVNITNITLGSEKLDKGQYKFIGFDCGVSTGSGGLDLRGDGIKIYFNHDGSDMFLRISGIGIDLIIPGTASESDAALIVKGYLSIKEDEYTGAVAFKLPKAKIAGGAAMKMRPKIPAFAIDAFVELAAPLPLGPTGLGIFAFRGLFGLRYIADLPAGATSNPDKMFDFYTEKKPNPLNANLPEKGLHLGKIVTPAQRADGFKSSGTPISIGAGIGLGTSADAGRAFSMQAFLFLSLPEFFMISGKGNVLSERVGIISETEPPFFAYMAITSEYISVGLGAEYLIRPNEGQILELHAEAQMAFFFNDPSAWYIHFGTKAEPNQAKILKKIFNLNAYAYLMLSAEGIETGAGIKFEMHKKYGPVRVDVSAYGDIYAMISFRKPQVGGGIACGGRISASAFGVGFDITLDAYLVLTAPKPFMVKGGAHICLEVNLRIKKWKKCIDIDFKWELEQSNDLTEIKVLDTIPFPVCGYHMGSKNTYKLSYFNTLLPNPANNTLEIIPLDTFIDIQFKKPVNPNNVIAKIGGVNNPPAKNRELVPPKAVEKQVTHLFEIEDIYLKVWNGNTNSWQDYNPYKALDQSAYLQNVNASTLKLGYWQKKGKEYNNLRVLSNSPFSYADDMPGDFIPEQMGLTAGTLFCPAKETDNHCVKWNESLTYAFDKWYSYQNITFRITKFDGVSVPFPNVFNLPVSLRINNQSTLEIILPEKCLEASFRLFSFAETLKISFYDLQDTTVTQNGVDRNQVEYVLIQELSLHAGDYSAPVRYESSDQTIKKIVVEAVRADDHLLNQLTNELNELIQLKLEQGGTAFDSRIRELTRTLSSLQMLTCNTTPRKAEIRELERLIRLLDLDIENLKRKAENIRVKRDEACNEVSAVKCILDELLEEKRAADAREDLFDDDPCPGSPFNDLLDQLRELKEKQQKEFDLARSEAIAKVEEALQIADETCQMLSAQYEEMLEEIRQAEEKLDGLKKQLEIIWSEDTDRCSTFIHEVCYLTQTESWYNQTIPSQEAIEADHNAFSDAVSKVIAPVWRPDETYAIEIKTSEIINNSPIRQTYYFAFKTAGPIGHFPLKYLQEELKKQYGLDADGIPKNTNSSFSIEPVIPENALKFYIDYEKSYPNPIGNIINQKPLFYNDPDLLIFYTEPFVYHFFNDWPDYNALGKRFASMKLEVKDPAEHLQQPADIPPVLTIRPNAVLEWKIDTTPPVKQSIEVMNNLRDPRIKNADFNGQTCWQIGGDPIVPASKNTDIKVENLKPSKLYNVNVFSRYSRDGNVFEEKQVHSYPFQTSRYAGLNEQVNSYHLQSFDDSGLLLNSLDAIYNISYDLNSLSTTFGQLRNIILKNDVANNFNANLIKNYPDPFQRLLFGYLKQKPLHAALSTEINLLLNENDEVFGIWVRNPEPFNDPRIPFADMQNSVKLLRDDQPLAGAGPLFSKDNSEFLILHRGLSQPLSSVKLTFIYFVWNGNAYLPEQTVTTENLIQL
jgi:hypothetical protein